MEVKFDTVKLYCEKDHDPDLFSFSYRAVDDNDFYYISISPDVQFYCESTGKSLTARGLSQQGEGIETKIIRAKLLLLDDSNNTKRLREYLTFGKNNLEKVIDLGYDGVVMVNNSKRSTSPICHSLIFVFREGILEEVDNDRCGIVRYSKKNNSRIRESIKDFPTCEEIDASLKEYSCSMVSKTLINIIGGYENYT